MKSRLFGAIVLGVGAVHLGVLWWASDILVFHYPVREASPPVANFYTETVTSDATPDAPPVVIEKRFTVSTKLAETLSTPPPPTERPELTPPSQLEIFNAEKESGKRPARPNRSVSVFHLTAEGHRIVYLIDASGSMWQKEGKITRFERAQREVARSIAALPEDMEFNVIYFADRTSALADRPRYASVRAKEDALRFLTTTPDLRGETALVEGLGAALQQQPDHLFVLTDGIANRRPNEVLSAAADVWKKNSGRTQIHAVGLGLKPGGTEAELLKKLTSLTDGKFEIDRR